jgi:hypothetical protein
VRLKVEKAHGGGLKFKELDLRLSKLMAMYHVTDVVIADAKDLGELAQRAFDDEAERIRREGPFR